MGRELYFDLDPADENYDDQKAAVENVWPHDSVSVKYQNVSVIADAAKAVDIDPTRFRELMRVQNGDDGSTDSNEGGGAALTNREFTLSRGETRELCQFTREVLEAIDATIDVEDATARFYGETDGEGEEESLTDFESTLLKARFTLSVIDKMCEVADEHELSMEVV